MVVVAARRRNPKTQKPRAARSAARFNGQCYAAGMDIEITRCFFASLKVPVLLVHHRDDACRSTPYVEAHHLSKRFPLVSVKGGLPPQSDPCQAMSAHGFLGKEAETVDAIAGWMLGTP